MALYPAMLSWRPERDDIRMGRDEQKLEHARYKKWKLPITGHYCNYPWLQYQIIINDNQE